MVNKTVASTIIGLICVVALGVAGWQFGWWLEGKNVDRQVQIDNRQKGTQSAWRDEARNAITDYNLIDPSNTAARGALRNKACSLIVRLVPSYLDADLETFQLQECA